MPQTSEDNQQIYFIFLAFPLGVKRPHDRIFNWIQSDRYQSVYLLLIVIASHLYNQMTDKCVDDQIALGNKVGFFSFTENLWNY